eukprot:scaffold138801_cov17-Prasinocladus_malaysianus.AAC.1
MTEVVDLYVPVRVRVAALAPHPRYSYGLIRTVRPTAAITCNAAGGCDLTSSDLCPSSAPYSKGSCKLSTDMGHT